MISNRFWFIWALACCFLVPIVPLHAQPFNVNLVTNGDAEAGPVSVAPPGWTTTTVAVVAYGSGGFPLSTDPGPPNRGQNFFAGGNSSPSSAQQLIDVSGGAVIIDTGQVQYHLAGYLGGFTNQSDRASLSATFRDAGNSMLGSAAIGPVSSTDRHGVTGLVLRQADGGVPVGTRTIQLVMQMIRDIGAFNDGYADNLSLMLTTDTPGPFDLVSPANEGPCRATCRFRWGTPAVNGGVSKFALYIDGSLQRDNITPDSEYMLSIDEALPDGAHLWKVAACGPTGECLDSTSTFTTNVDGVPPAPFTLIAPSETAWESLNDTFSLQWAPASDGASDTPSGLDHYDVSIDEQVATTVPAAQTSVSSDASALHSALPDGIHTWTVTAVDQAGNPTTAPGRTIRIDSTAPTFPSFTPVPADRSYTADTTPAVQWQLATDGGSGVASQQVVLDSSDQFDPGAVATSFEFPAPLADGLHNWYVQATDQAGNSTATPTFSFVVDTTPPAGLQLSSTFPGTPDGAVVSSGTPQMCWGLPADAGSGLAGFRLYINGVLTGSDIVPAAQASQCTTPPTGLSDGRYEWYIEAFDKLGNTARALQTFTFFVDTLPPTVFKLLTPADQSLVAEARPMFSWTASSDAGSGLDHYEVSIDSGAGGECPTPCDVAAAQTAFVPAHDLSVGSHSWLVAAIDRAGRHTLAGPSSFVVAPTPTPMPTATPTPTIVRCVGDCDSSGDVGVNELITMVNIALGTAPPSTCPHGIPSGADVDIALIIRAVTNALTSCPAA